MPILIFILVLSILVFVHELGHFLVARRSKIGVHEFGFGFPPRVLGIRRGSVLYSINAIPFGGFVRLVGEGEGEENAPDSFLRASIGKRLAVLLAGVAMNILLAWVLLSATFAIGLRLSTDSATTLGRPKLTAVRSEIFVSAGSPAHQAGLRSGDILTSVNGQTISSTTALIQYTKEHNYPPLEIVIDRGQHRQALRVTPRSPAQDQKPLYGFGVEETGLLRYPIWQAPVIGVRALGFFTIETLRGLGRFGRELLVQGRVADDVAGPVGIAVLTSEISRLGFAPLLQFMAVLSVSLAIMNVLPLPALDGGRVLFTIIEAIRGRPVNARWERTIHSVGFIALLLLIAFISVRDVQRFDVWSRIVHLFQ